MKVIMGTFVAMVAFVAAYGAFSDYCYYKSQSNK